MCRDDLLHEAMPLEIGWSAELHCRRNMQAQHAAVAAASVAAAVMSCVVHMAGCTPPQQLYDVLGWLVCVVRVIALTTRR